jgi:hypothetical protein
MTMRTTRKHIAPLLAAVAVVASICRAPVATADEPDPPSPPSQTCSQLGATEYKCESPGNAQLNDAPPVTDFFPQGDD